MSRRVVFLVTHLMGSGHLVRTLALARAVAAAGGAARVISGGRPLAHVDARGVDVVALPPVTTDGVDYSRLLDLDGRPAGEALLAERRRAAADAVAEARPDVLVVETWPFGRRLLASEFEAAVEAARGAWLYASIRDVLEPPSKPKRVAAALQRLQRFAGVLVHGDASVIGLEESWPGQAGPAPGLAERLSYTGYVIDAPPEVSSDPGEEVLVAVGGGVIGRRLLEIAARASALSLRPWRLRVGGSDAAPEAARLSRLGPAIAEPTANDYRARLASAAASVSLCGYNTAVETALCGTPALLVPMEEGGEQEQLIRARAFARLPGIETARIGDLTPEILAARVETLVARPRDPVPLRADGAAEAARILLSN